jgi:hypothetical protein
MRIPNLLSLAACATLAACGDDDPTPPPRPTFRATLTGAAERPNAVNTPAAGTAVVVLDGATATYTITFSDLTGTPTGVHIHGPADATRTAGVVVNFPVANVAGTTGTVTGTFTTTNSAAVSLDSLASMIRAGNAYVNVHSARFPGGEIRGQLAAAN